MWKDITSLDNILAAHECAKKGKLKRPAVRKVDENIQKYAADLQDLLLSRSYRTSQYRFFEITERGKTREIADLPYFPDRIAQWALMRVVEPIFLNNLIYTTYAALPGRGTHRALNRLHRWMKEDVDGTQYCLKLDIKKFFPSIDKAVLKDRFRKIIKDKDALWLMDEIVDSYPKSGIPIGNYTSQYFGNYYLSQYDHWLKEDLQVKYYLRYMDDMILLSDSKEQLREWFWMINDYLTNNLHLTIKENWQIFPVDVRGIDFVGYRSFRDYTLIRKQTKKNYQDKVGILVKRLESGGEFTESDRSMLASYKGILQHGDCYRLQKKVTAPIVRTLDDFQ